MSAWQKSHTRVPPHKWFFYNPVGDNRSLWMDLSSNDLRVFTRHSEISGLRVDIESEVDLAECAMQERVKVLIEFDNSLGRDGEYKGSASLQPSYTDTFKSIHDMLQNVHNRIRHQCLDLEDLEVCELSDQLKAELRIQKRAKQHRQSDLNHFKWLDVFECINVFTCELQKDIDRSSKNHFWLRLVVKEFC